MFERPCRRGRIEKALSLAVDLSAWDLFCDARWAAERRALTALATEAASLALHYADNAPGWYTFIYKPLLNIFF